MLGTTPRRGARPASIGLLAVLAIATGGTAPVLGGADRQPTFVTDSVTAAFASTEPVREANAERAATRDAAWEDRATAALVRTTAPHGALIRPAQALRIKALAIANAPTAPKATASAEAFRGRNHFWIPALGMSYAVYPYACSRTSRPGNYMYRWGCAGTNNVYILGHAATVMKPLHDLYARGGLRAGLVALYADGSGRIRAYQVTEWRIASPTQIAWQIASQPVPSMTLQTCYGPNDRYRLNVRLVAMT